MIATTDGLPTIVLSKFLLTLKVLHMASFLLARHQSPLLPITQTTNLKTRYAIFPLIVVSNLPM